MAAPLSWSAFLPSSLIAASVEDASGGKIGKEPSVEGFEGVILICDMSGFTKLSERCGIPVVFCWSLASAVHKVHPAHPHLSAVPRRIQLGAWVCVDHLQLVVGQS
jgi:hypothetical protein